MSPIDASAPDFETPQHADGRGNTQSRYDYPFGISVNALGLRFFDEGISAAPLLKTIDSSPLFEASEFSVAPIHSPNGEIFRIRTNREAPKP